MLLLEPGRRIEAGQRGQSRPGSAEGPTPAPSPPPALAPPPAIKRKHQFDGWTMLVYRKPDLISSALSSLQLEALILHAKIIVNYDDTRTFLREQ